MLLEVVRKGIQDKTQMILVIPEFKRPTTPLWFSLAMQHARKKFQIKEGQRVFLREDRTTAGPTRWDVWGIFFDGQIFSSQCKQNAEMGHFGLLFGVLMGDGAW